MSQDIGVNVDLGNVFEEQKVGISPLGGAQQGGAEEEAQVR